MGSAEPIRGTVARLITDDELVINRGFEEGVSEGMFFEVLDPLAMDVRDYQSGKVLGSLKRVKARIRVTQVGDHLSLCRAVNRTGLGGVATLLSGGSRSLSGDSWPDGVRSGDPVAEMVVEVPPKA